MLYTFLQKAITPLIEPQEIPVLSTGFTTFMASTSILWTKFPDSPYSWDGMTTDNGIDQYFLGGILQQDPSLLQVDDVVYRALGSHCGSFALLNNTALVVGINITSKEVATIFAVQSGPLTPDVQGQFNSNGDEISDLYAGGIFLSTDGQFLLLVSNRNIRHARAQGDSAEQETFVSS